MKILSADARAALVIIMVIYAITLGLSYVAVSLDLFFNPWIKELELQWWNFFTTKHFLTWLYANDPVLWFIITSAISLSVILIALITAAFSHS